MPMPYQNGKPDWPAWFASNHEVTDEVIRLASDLFT